MEDNRLPIQETPEGRAYKAWTKYIKSKLNSGFRSGTIELGDDPELRELMESNEALVKFRAINPGGVHYDDILRNMSVMYANDAFIADRVMPTVFTSGALSGGYFTYDLENRTDYPDDTMTDRSDPNELTENRSKATYGLQPRSLKEYVDMLTIQNETAPLSELMDAQENVLYGLMFNREKRVLAAITTAGNYAGNTDTLSGAEQFNDTGGTPANPLVVVDALREKMWNGNGAGRMVGVVPLEVHNVLKKHPSALAFLHSGGVNPQSVTRQNIAAWLELDEYLVTGFRVNTANEGAAATYTRAMGDYFAILRVANSPSLRNAAFGYSLQATPVTQGTFWEPTRGSKGAYMCRSSFEDQQLVVAGLTSGLLIDVLE